MFFLARLKIIPIMVFCVYWVGRLRLGRGKALNGLAPLTSRLLPRGGASASNGAITAAVSRNPPQGGSRCKPSLAADNIKIPLRLPGAPGKVRQGRLTVASGQAKPNLLCCIIVTAAGRSVGRSVALFSRLRVSGVG